jgi:hypothetical protein
LAAIVWLEAGRVNSATGLSAPAKTARQTLFWRYLAVSSAGGLELPAVQGVFTDYFQKIFTLIKKSCFKKNRLLDR